MINVMKPVFEGAFEKYTAAIQELTLTMTLLIICCPEENTHYNTLKNAFFRGVIHWAMLERMHFSLRI